MADNEWYTPPEYIDAVKEVLAYISLDPTSNEFAQRNVQAGTFWTIEDDALTLPWMLITSSPNKVFMNPPYSNAGHFVTKMVKEYRLGNIDEGIMLLNVSTSSSWWQQLWDYPICFVEKRIKFLKYDYDNDDFVAGGSPRYANAFIYLGDNPEYFAHVFNYYGTVVVPYGDERYNR